MLVALERVHGYFNSQPHKEADVVSNQFVCEADNFNSQPHKEADPIIRSIPPVASLFQLTASQGG